ncbi:MAG: FGGY family carbohydrate kinase [archaeon]
MTAVAIDIDEGKIVYDSSIDYRQLVNFGINNSYILPQREPGEADQPPMMYLAALETVLAGMKNQIDLSKVVVINNSGQQHGHVYLNNNAKNKFAYLQKACSSKQNLISIFNDSFAIDRAPIWMTSNTAAQADFIRNFVGGKKEMIRLSGSDSPLRFTGAIIRKIGCTSPELYRQTYKIQLISSLIPAVLSGNTDAPWDYGNASGTSLMDYEKKQLSDKLVGAVSDSLPGGINGLYSKLPSIKSPIDKVGKVAKYYSVKYGLNPEAIVLAGSGDNPQSKVLVPEDLLSLGTSFVFMSSSNPKDRDWKGVANSMYDGIGNPFIFGCRTNGALVWDMIRERYGFSKKDYSAPEHALELVHPGTGPVVVWQPRVETFPKSKQINLTRFNSKSSSLSLDYNGVIESSLGLLYISSTDLSSNKGKILYVTGGASYSSQVMRRISGIWNKPVVAIKTGGAALGTAVAGAVGFSQAGHKVMNRKELLEKLMPHSAAIQPRPEDIFAYHSQQGYLKKLEDAFQKLCN